LIQAGPPTPAVQTTVPCAAYRGTFGLTRLGRLGTFFAPMKLMVAVTWAS